jgi:hypothetical protein
MVQYTRRRFETDFDKDRNLCTNTYTYMVYSKDIKNATSGMCPRNILLFVKMRYNDNPREIKDKVVVILLISRCDWLM